MWVRSNTASERPAAPRRKLRRVPGREVLFTVLRREDKYKAKSFTDTFVYRAGDQIGAWSYPLLPWFGLGLTGISFVAAPLVGIWCMISLWLGKEQVAMARVREL